MPQESDEDRGYVEIVPAQRMNGEVYILMVNQKGEKDYGKLDDVIDILEIELEKEKRKTEMRRKKI